MSRTTKERNKTLVLEAFDALFNKRDYEAAERNGTWRSRKSHADCGLEIYGPTCDNEGDNVYPIMPRRP